jgi:DMSO/TMAO reductase YedYZ molybdopterin-dependent catalytic subunit
MSFEPNKQITTSQLRRKTLVGVLSLLIFFAACTISWMWLQHQPKSNSALKPLRAGLDLNEKIFSGIFGKRLAKAYGIKDAVKNPKVNGKDGLANAADTANWKLHLVRSPGDTLLLTMNDIKALPKTEVIFDFKCIEGWSQVTYWGGVRFSDFIKKYGLTAQSEMKYSGLETPDKAYYVGIDMKSMLHPQTILCYEMNGKPLPLNQGYPLRLIIPVKYGIKHLKRIGTLFFANERPKDFWYEQGYDYYSGL